MPLEKVVNDVIFCWKNRESSKELFKQIQHKELHQTKIASFKSEERVKQYLTNRLLIQKFIGDYPIKKGKNNKPYIDKSNTEVSFSHNRNYTILMVGTKPCGIDVQVPTEKALRVKHKFINQRDFCYESNDQELLSKIWSCKEAAFKQFGTNEIYLKPHISVVEALNNNTFKVEILIDRKVHSTVVKQELLENNYLSYTL